MLMGIQYFKLALLINGTTIATISKKYQVDDSINFYDYCDVLLVFRFVPSFLVWLTFQPIG